MEEYIENGAALGWLIDVQDKKVYVYQQNATVQKLVNPSAVSGEPLLSGFVLQMKNFFGG
jgi:Uma2 family endonuclease